MHGRCCSGRCEPSELRGGLARVKNRRRRLVIVVSAQRETNLFDAVALHGSTWPQRLCIGSTLVNNIFSLCPMMEISLVA
jgi:hypothetical protein